MLSNLKTESLLNTGRRSRERQASAKRPNLVATLKYLICHLKTHNKLAKLMGDVSGVLNQEREVYKSRFIVFIGVSFFKSLETRTQKVQARKSKNNTRERISKLDTIPMKLLIMTGLETVMFLLLPRLLFCNNYTKISDIIYFLSNIISQFGCLVKQKKSYRKLISSIYFFQQIRVFPLVIINKPSVNL